MTKLSIVLLGGTASKVSSDHFDNSYIGALLAQSRLSPLVETKVVDLFSRDSTTFTDEEIQTVASAIEAEAALSDGVIVVMGTDGMVSVCKKLQVLCRPRVPVAVTGSIMPYRWGFSDAAFNFGFALAVARTYQPGLWVCMNGLILAPESAEKDYEKQMFCPLGPA